MRTGDAGTAVTAQRPGRLGRDHERRLILDGTFAYLLNARGRLGRDHSRQFEREAVKFGCSTPGGVLVGITCRRPRRLRGLVLLNARGRLGRDHPASTRAAAARRRAAQRPGASWSGSRTSPSSGSSRPRPAQRPGASWSGSHGGQGGVLERGRLLNARGRLGRDHGLRAAGRSAGGAAQRPGRLGRDHMVGFPTRRGAKWLLNARGRLGRDHSTPSPRSTP